MSTGPRTSFPLPPSGSSPCWRGHCSGEGGGALSQWHSGTVPLPSLAPDEPKQRQQLWGSGLGTPCAFVAHACTLFSRAGPAASLACSASSMLTYQVQSGRMDATHWAELHRHREPLLAVAAAFQAACAEAAACLERNAPISSALSALERLHGAFIALGAAASSTPGELWAQPGSLAFSSWFSLMFAAASRVRAAAVAVRAARGTLLCCWAATQGWLLQSPWGRSAHATRPAPPCPNVAAAAQGVPPPAGRPGSRPARSSARGSGLLCWNA